MSREARIGGGSCTVRSNASWVMAKRDPCCGQNDGQTGLKTLLPTTLLLAVITKGISVDSHSGFPIFIQI